MRFTYVYSINILFIINEYVVRTELLCMKSFDYVKFHYSLFEIDNIWAVRNYK